MIKEAWELGSRALPPVQPSFQSHELPVAVQASAKEKCELDVALADARARASAAEDKIAAQAATLKEQAEHVHNLEV